MIDGIPLKMCGYKTKEVINRARLITAHARYMAASIYSIIYEILGHWRSFLAEVTVISVGSDQENYAKPHLGEF